MFKGMIFKTNDFVKDTVAFLIIKKKGWKRETVIKGSQLNKQSDPKTTRNTHMNSIYNQIIFNPCNTTIILYQYLSFKKKINGNH